MNDDPQHGWDETDRLRRRAEVRERRLRARRRRRRGLLAVALLAVVGVGGAIAIREARKPPPPPPPPPPLTPVTFPEGIRREEMAAILGAKTRLPPDEYLAITGPSSRGAQLAGTKRPVSLEGFLFPATYRIGTDTTTAFLVDRQIAAFERTMAGIDLRAARRKNLSRYDVVIIASMIEREVRVPAERRIVAGVIENRLRRGMRLDIDATVQYAVGAWRPLTGADLESPSPYNTRRFAGLPPGPICNPGEASLRAAANPAKHDYLYYVAREDGTGRHRFARTLEEFNRIQAEIRAGG